MPQNKIHITVISNAGSGSRTDVEIESDMTAQDVVNKFIGSGQEMLIRINGRKVEDPASTTLNEGDRVTATPQKVHGA
jgi:sulfur carrier protein ThiS